jgi:hypothetical protein
MQVHRQVATGATLRIDMSSRNLRGSWVRLPYRACSAPIERIENRERYALLIFCHTLENRLPIIGRLDFPGLRINLWATPDVKVVVLVPLRRIGLKLGERILAEPVMLRGDRC